MADRQSAARWLAHIDTLTFGRNGASTLKDIPVAMLADLIAEGTDLPVPKPGDSPQHALEMMQRGLELLTVGVAFESWIEAYGNDTSRPTTRPSAVRTQSDGVKVEVWRNKTDVIVIWTERDSRGRLTEEGVSLPLTTPLTKAVQNFLEFVARDWEKVVQSPPSRGGVGL